MTFDEHLEQILMLLQRDGRVTYRALKRRLEIDDDYLADLTAEIIDAKRLAIDEDGRVLVWVGTDQGIVKGTRRSRVVSSQNTVIPLTPRPQHPAP